MYHSLSLSLSLSLTLGLPPGVCNIVFGTGTKAGEALVTHPDVPIISFTGSTATGERIQRVSAPYCKKLSLEVSQTIEIPTNQICLYYYSLAVKMPVLSLLMSILISVYQ